MYRADKVSAFRGIVDKYSGHSDAGGYTIRTWLNGLYFSLRNSTGNNIFPSPVIATSKDTWTFVTAVFNGTNGLLYVNAGTPVVSSVNTSAIDITDQTFKIGYNHNNAGYWNGSIDEVMIFNTSINSSDVSTIYNLGRNRGSYKKYNSEYLVSHWRFDESLNDDKGINNGTLQGDAGVTEDQPIFSFNSTIDFQNSHWQIFKEDNCSFVRDSGSIIKWTG
jgi:hypothetical protein